MDGIDEIDEINPNGLKVYGRRTFIVSIIVYLVGILLKLAGVREFYRFKATGRFLLLTALWQYGAGLLFWRAKIEREEYDDDNDD